MSMQTQTDPERSEETQTPTTTDRDIALMMVDIGRSLGRLEGTSQNFATKADVADVRLEVAEAEQRMSEKVSALAAEVAEVRIEVAEVRAEVAQIESRLIKWIVGTGVVLFIGLGGLLFALLQWLISTLP